MPRSPTSSKEKPHLQIIIDRNELEELAAAARLYGLTVSWAGAAIIRDALRSARLVKILQRARARTAGRIQPRKDS